jgi:hypothetical protein
VLVVKEHDSTVAEVGTPVNMSASGNGYVTETVVLSGVEFGDTPLHVAFMSEQGEFYVDDVKISLIVPTSGTVVEIPFKIFETTETYYSLTDLSAGDYAYQVVVKRTKDFLSYTSNYSNRVDVKLLSTDVENVLGDKAKGDKTMKVIREGQLMIVREGNTYNIIGQKM